MKPTITFDKTAVTFIVSAFNKTLDKDGYIITLNGKRVKCGVCKKPILAASLGGVVKHLGFVCDDIACLMAISNMI